MSDPIAQIRAALNAGPTPGEWTALDMVHADRGDAMTPDEIGEYVKNSVIASAENGGTLDRFLFISVETEAGIRDLCHIGNGRNGPANAAYIAACHPEAMRALLDRLDAQAAEIERLRTELGIGETRNERLRT